MAPVLRFGFPKPLEMATRILAGKVVNKISKGAEPAAEIVHNRAARIQRERVVKAEYRDVHPGLDRVAAGRIAQRLLDLPGLVGPSLAGSRLSTPMEGKLMSLPN